MISKTSSIKLKTANLRLVTSIFFTYFQIEDVNLLVVSYLTKQTPSSPGDLLTQSRP